MSCLRNKRNLAILLAVTFGALVCACGEDDDNATIDSGTTDTDAAECEQDETRCVEDMLQICEAGEWVDEMDCAALDLECRAITDHGTVVYYRCHPLIVLLDDFESYSSGDYIVETAGEPWQTWSDPPLTGEDAQVSDSQAVRGVNSLYIAPNNNVLFDYNAGSYFILAFEMFVEPGKMAYYNFPLSVDWLVEIEVFFYPDGQGKLVLYSDSYVYEEDTFEFPVGQWFTCTHLHENDFVTFSIDGNEIHTWDEVSYDSFFEEGIEFWGRTVDAGPGFYIDDIRLLNPGYWY